MIHAIGNVCPHPATRNQGCSLDLVEFDLRSLFVCSSRELEGREMLGRKDAWRLAAAWTCEGLAAMLLERWVEASA